MRRHVLCAAADLPTGTHRVFDVDGRRIGVFNIDGILYALPNICPHQAGPLCEAKKLTGTLIATGDTSWQPEWVYADEIVACPWHGLEFHVPTGRCIAYGHIRLRRFEVVVEEGEVVLNLPASRRSSRPTGT